MSHTPAPWIVEKITGEFYGSNYQYAPFILVKGSDGDFVTKIDISNIAAYGLKEDANDKKEANAYLIAAAPEMFEAIKQAQKEIRNATNHIKRMSGYTGGVCSSEDFADAACIQALNILNRALAKAENLNAPKPLQRSRSKCSVNL